MWNDAPGSLLITPLLPSSGANRVGPPLAFPDFAPRLLASLVASSTAACTSGVVTVTAAAHGITATTYDGSKFYYPGSPTLAAGWYDGFSRTGVNDLTFLAPTSPNFGSESVNAGAAFTSDVVFQSVTVPANTLSVGSCLNARVFTASSTAAGTKTTRLRINGTVAIILQNTSTSSVVLARDLSIIVATPTKAYSNSNQVSTGSTSAATPTIDISTAMDVAISGQLDTAGMFLFMLCPKLEIF